MDTCMKQGRDGQGTLLYGKNHESTRDRPSSLLKL